MAKQQRKNPKLGSKESMEEAYKEIETTIFKSAPKYKDGSLKLKKINGEVYARCSRGLRPNKFNLTHKDDRWLPIREFSISKVSVTKLQNACRDCDHNYIMKKSGRNK